MRQFLQKRIFPVLVCLVFIATMALPVAAVDDDSAISLSEPSKIFNNDGTVTVTYDLPLNPYSKIYGLPAEGNDFVFICDSTNIYFTNNFITKTITNYDILADLGTFENVGALNKTINYDWSGLNLSSITGIMVNGIIYPVIADYNIVTDSIGRVVELFGFQTDHYNAGSSFQVDVAYNVVFRRTVSDDGSYINYQVVLWVTNYYQEPYDATVGVLTSEDIQVAEYDTLYAVLYPFGETNYIDVSDIRSGGTFDVSVTYDYNIQLTGTDTTTTFIQYVDFYGEDGKLISSTDYIIDSIDVADGASMTIDTTLTVPDGACYMDMEISTDPFDVSDVALLDWRISDMQMTFDMSDVEANSLMMSGIIDRLDTLVKEALEANESLDEIIELLQQIINNQSSAGCDHSTVEDFLQQLLEQQQQNGSQLTPTPEQSDKAEDLEDDIRDEAANIENNNSMLEQLTPSRPVINTDLNLDPVFLSAASPLVANIWSISGMGSIIGVVLAVATVAYIFFGKRDG